MKKAIMTAIIFIFYAKCILYAALINPYEAHSLQDTQKVMISFFEIKNHETYETAKTQIEASDINKILNGLNKTIEYEATTCDCIGDGKIFFLLRDGSEVEFRIKHEGGILEYNFGKVNNQFLVMSDVFKEIIKKYYPKENLSTAAILPSAEVIAAIENRGKEIADYERVAIKATDLLLATNLDRSKLEIYVAVKDNDRWMIYFGKVSNDGNSFVAPYTYSCPDGAFEEMGEFQDTRVVFTDTLQLAKAVKLALNRIGTGFPKYNTNVFREKDNTITVYLTPGNDNPEVILLGGDFKVSISPDGCEVLNKTPLHNSVLEIPLHIKHSKEPAGAFHTHVLDDLPTETDVAIVLLNPQLAPHYITGKNWMSRIDANGKITILGKTEEILKPE